MLKTCGTCNKSKEENVTLASCTRCRRVYYCSKECQIKDWKNGHKIICSPQSTAPTIEPQSSPTSSIRAVDRFYVLMDKFDAGTFGTSDRREAVDLQKVLEAAARDGDLESQFTLAEIYRFGLCGIEQNVSLSLHWCSLAAEKGDPASQLLLGEDLLDQGNYNDAAMWIMKSADQNYVEAQYYMGYIHAEGAGVQKNLETAVSWYLRAANQGHVDAQYALAKCFANGNGTPKDVRQATKWFELAIDQAKKLGDVNIVKKCEKEYQEFVRKNSLKGPSIHDAFDHMKISALKSLKYPNETSDLYQSSPACPATSKLGRAEIISDASTQPDLSFESSTIDPLNGRNHKLGDLFSPDVDLDTLRGCRFTLQGLKSKQELNGQRCTFAQLDSLNGRVVVTLDSKRTISVRFENLEADYDDVSEPINAVGKSSGNPPALTCPPEVSTGVGARADGVAPNENLERLVQQLSTSMYENYDFMAPPITKFNAASAEQGSSTTDTLEVDFSNASRRYNEVCLVAIKKYGGQWSSLTQADFKKGADAVRLLIKVAEAGHADAQSIVALAYHHGYGVEKNDSLAIEWWEKSATQGNMEALYFLGNMFAEGQGVLESDSKAAVFWTHAAQKGHLQARRNLGYAYAAGRGVEKDTEKSALLLWHVVTMAVAQGDEETEQWTRQVLSRFSDPWIGAKVELHGLDDDPDMNGAQGLILENVDGQYTIQLTTGEDYICSADYFVRISDFDDDSEDDSDPGSTIDPCANFEKVQYQLRFLTLNDFEESDTEMVQQAIDLLVAVSDEGDFEAMYKLAAAFYHGKVVEQDSALSFKWATQAAERGQKDAQSLLATMYSTGYGVDKDDSRAADWWFKAAENGVASAQYNLSLLFKYGSGVAKSRIRALYWCRKGAENGSVHAMYDIGCSFAEGNGVECSMKEAHRWFSLAAAEGFGVAQFRLGYGYEIGEYGNKDLVKSAEWFLKCAESSRHSGNNDLARRAEERIVKLGTPHEDDRTGIDDRGAEYNAGGITSKGKYKINSLLESSSQDGRMREAAASKSSVRTTKSSGVTTPKPMDSASRRSEAQYLEAKQKYDKIEFRVKAGIDTWAGLQGKTEMNHIEKLLLAAGGVGHLEAQYFLGVLFESGNGVKEQIDEAIKWLSKAGINGHLDAMYKLGCLFSEDIEGVERNDSKALEWFVKAAEEGHLGSQFLAGHLFQNGIGVTHDRSAAFAYYLAASERGCAKSQNNLAIMLEKGTDENQAEAFKWYKRAAEQGFETAEYNLGIQYYYGLVCERNLSEAVVWFTKAAQKGSTNANNLIGKAYLSGGDGLSQDHLKAAVWFKKAVASGDLESALDLADVYERGLIGGKVDEFKAHKCWSDAAVSPDPKISNRAHEALKKLTDKYGESHFDVHAVASPHAHRDFAVPRDGPVPPKSDLPVTQSVTRNAPSLNNTTAKDTPFQRDVTPRLMPVSRDVPIPRHVPVPQAPSSLAKHSEDPDGKIAKKTRTSKKHGPGSQPRSKSEVLSSGSSTLSTSEVANSVVLDDKNDQIAADLVAADLIAQDELERSLKEARLQKSRAKRVSEKIGDAHARFNQINQRANFPGEGPITAVPSAVAHNSKPHTLFSRSAPDVHLANLSVDSDSHIPALEQGLTEMSSSDIKTVPFQFACKADSLAQVVQSQDVVCETVATGTYVASIEFDSAMKIAMEKSLSSEMSRAREDELSQILISKLCLLLQEAEKGWAGIYNPPRDGDCLLKCALEHDFGCCASATGVRDWRVVGSHRETSARPTAAPTMSTGDLRKAVVARVRESGLAKLAAILQDPNIAQRSLSPLQLQRSHETALGDLESSCATMRKPGVVMSEEELQALADIRGACVQVLTVVCIRESSDFGMVLRPRLYSPTPLPGPPGLFGLGMWGALSDGGQGTLYPRGFVGKGDTLVLLQEARAHSMSHFQLLRLSLPSPPPVVQKSYAPFQLMSLGDCDRS